MNKSIYKLDNTSKLDELTKKLNDLSITVGYDEEDAANLALFKEHGSVLKNMPPNPFISTAIGEFENNNKIKDDLNKLFSFKNISSGINTLYNNTVDILYNDIVDALDPDKDDILISKLKKGI